MTNEKERLPEGEESLARPSTTGRVEQTSQTAGDDFREMLELPKGVTVRCLDNIDDPAQAELYAQANILIEREFDDSEIVHDPELIEAAVRDWGYRYTVAIENGEVIAVAAGAVLDLDGLASEYERSELENGEMREQWERAIKLTYGAYLVTEEKWRGRGIGHVVRSQMMDRLNEEAKKIGGENIGHLVEAAGSGEIQEDTGSYRMYILKEGTYHEVPYFAAPLEYEEQTGEPLYFSDKGKFDPHAAPYRLMFAPRVEGHLLYVPASGEQEISVEQLEQMVIAMRNYNAEYDSGDMPETAGERADAVLEEYETELAEFLEQAEDGRVHLISSSQRKELEQQKRKFNDHEIAA